MPCPHPHQLLCYGRPGATASYHGNRELSDHLLDMGSKSTNLAIVLCADVWALWSSVMPSQAQFGTHEPQSVYGSERLAIVDMPRKPDVLPILRDNQGTVERGIGAKAKKSDN